MEEKKIEKLYELLDRTDRECDNESSAAIRLAIFHLENRYGSYRHIFRL